MIATIRNKLRGTGFRIAMGIMVLLIAIVWLSPPLSEMSRNHEYDNSWIVDINGNKIQYSEFIRKYRVVDQQIQMIKQQYGPYADYFLQSKGIPSDPQEIVLNELTTEALLNQVSLAVPIDISSDYIQEKLKDRLFVQSSGLSQLLPPSLIGQDGTVDSTILRNYLKHINMSAQQFDESIEHMLERIMVSELIGLSAYVPSFQLKNALANKHARKKFSILSWSFDSILEQEKNKELADDEVQKFYADQSTQHKRYWVPEKRAGTAWIFKPESYGIDITDQDIEKYYARSKSTFIERPVQMQVRRILLNIEDESLEEERYALAKEIEQQLKTDPTQFAALAEKHSDDASTAEKGGLLEPFSKGTYDKQFEQMAFLLKNDNDISNIFKSKDAGKGDRFEIIQRVSKSPVLYKPLSSVKEDIYQKILLDTFKRKFVTDVARLTKKPSAEQLQLFIQEHNAVQQEAIAPTADSGSARAHALFTIKKDEVTSVIDQGQGFIVQLDDIYKKHLPDLDQIKDVVIQDIYTSKAYALLQEQMSDAKKRSAQESFDQLAEQYGATLSSTPLIDLSDAKSPDVLKEWGIPTDYFAALENVGGVLEYSAHEAGYLIRLDEQEPVSEQVFQDKSGEVRAALYKEEIGRYIKGFVASLHRSATINLNESLTAKIKDRAS